MTEIQHFFLGDCFLLAHPALKTILQFELEAPAPIVTLLFWALDMNDLTHLLTYKKHLKMLGPFATASRRTPHYHSPGVASVASHVAHIAIAQAACDSSACDSSDAW